MAELTFDESVLRFKDNEDRFDLFVNDAVGYLTREGVSVESVQAFMARLETEILSGNIILGVEVVTALPGSPEMGRLYSLTQTDGLAPVGLYAYDGNGFICFAQYEDISLPDWTGAVSQVLYSGVSYQVDVVAAVTSLDLTMTTNGLSRVLVDNPSLYAIEEPTGLYKMTTAGLDDLDTEKFRLMLQLDNAATTPLYEISTTESVLT